MFLDWSGYNLQVNIIPSFNKHAAEFVGQNSTPFNCKSVQTRPEKGQRKKGKICFLIPCL